MTREIQIKSKEEQKLNRTHRLLTQRGRDSRSFYEPSERHTDDIALQMRSALRALRWAAVKSYIRKNGVIRRGQRAVYRDRDKAKWRETERAKRKGAFKRFPLPIPLMVWEWNGSGEGAGWDGERDL